MSESMVWYPAGLESDHPTINSNLQETLYATYLKLKILLLYNNNTT